MATAKNKQNEHNRDELRARFTSWLDITLIRARSDYFDHLNSRPDEASFDQLPADLFPDPHDYFESVERGSDFEFEEVRIAQAFSCAFSNWKQEIFDKYINQWNIDITQLCSQLSKGAKIKVMIALALGHQPEMLILDEPTDGLDPHARAELLDIFREFVSDGEKSVIFSTHITSDLDKTADYIAVVSNGKITEVLTADETQEKYAVVSGDKTDGIEKYLIGMKKSEIGYEGLVLRENLAYFDDVTVRNPTYEDILMYTISGKRGE